MKTVLDMCCGSRVFWFDRTDPRVVFCDIRVGRYEMTDRVIEVKPDVQCDFRQLPFAANTFEMVVFDPPHLTKAGPRSLLRHKYGLLNRQTWREDLAKGFSEAFRVLKPGGTLIFKWNETSIKVKEILPLVNESPLFGHRSGKRVDTHWLCFRKGDNHDTEKDVRPGFLDNRAARAGGDGQ